MWLRESSTPDSVASVRREARINDTYQFAKCELSDVASSETSSATLVEVRWRFLAPTPMEWVEVAKTAYLDVDSQAPVVFKTQIRSWKDIKIVKTQSNFIWDERK